ncbi:MAG: DinB family protein [Chloroflexota bacterium]
MSERKTAVLAQLEKNRAQLFNALSKLDAAAWNKVIYSEETDAQWTTTDIVRHLLQAESGMTGLMKNIKTKGRGVPEDFDRSRYNRRQVDKLKDKTPRELIDQMSANRTALLAFIDTLDDDDWDKNGRHASLKIMTIEEVCQTIANHEIAHLNEILDQT